MNNCEHIWQTRTDWRAEDAGGWRVERQYRVRMCVECEQERTATSLPKRRRERARLDTGTPPDGLRDVVPAKQWRTLERALDLHGGTRLALEEIVREWLDAGWVAVEERRDRFGQAWRLTKVRLSEPAYERLVVRPSARKDREAAAEREAMLAFLQGWRQDAHAARRQTEGTDERAVVERLTDILEQQEVGLQTGEWVSLPGTAQQLGGSVHQRWLRVLRGLLATVAADTPVYERTFSARWLADSKALAPEWPALCDYLGTSLTNLGLYRHTPIALCWGHFNATCGDYRVDGRAGVPFTALSAETIATLDKIAVTATAVLVVENRTAFEALLRPPLRQDALLYLFSGGHAGRAERALLRAWLAGAPDVPWYVWTDWDVGGVRIQSDWARWAQHHSLPAPRPWMWDAQSLSRWKPVGTKLTAAARLDLHGLDTPLSDALVVAGYTLEQEAVIADLTPTDFAALTHITQVQ